MQPLVKCCLMFLCIGCSDTTIQTQTRVQPFYTRATQDYGFFIKLRDNKTNLLLDVFFRNATAKTIALTYGDWNCAFRFELMVNGKKYIYPPKPSFVVPSRPSDTPEDPNREVQNCHLVAYNKSIKPNLSFLFTTIQLPNSLAQALRQTKMKYAGEFYFSYSIDRQPPRLEIYKVP